MGQSHRALHDVGRCLGFPSEGDEAAPDQLAVSTQTLDQVGASVEVEAENHEQQSDREPASVARALHLAQELSPVGSKESHDHQHDEHTAFSVGEVQAPDELVKGNGVARSLRGREAGVDALAERSLALPQVGDVAEVLVGLRVPLGGQSLEAHGETVSFIRPVFVGGGVGGGRGVHRTGTPRARRSLGDSESPQWWRRGDSAGRVAVEVRRDETPKDSVGPGVPEVKPMDAATQETASEPQDEYLTVDETARVLKMSRSKLYRLIEEGEIGGWFMLGDRRMFCRTALLRWVEEEVSKTARRARRRRR